MTPWSDFLPYVLPSAPGCPDPVAEFNLRLAAQEFCARTRVWRETLPNIKALPARGIGPHFMELPDDSEIVRIERATMDGRPIDVMPADALPTDWRQYPNTIRDCVFTLDRKEVFAVPAYEVTRVLSMEVSLKPSEAADGLSDELASLYKRDIAAGALEIILMLPAFLNPALATVHGDKFKARIATTAIQVARGHSSFRPRARVRTF
jgi:hypothetical protein